jgi:hypothetical protein
VPGMGEVNVERIVASRRMLMVMTATAAPPM